MSRIRVYYCTRRSLFPLVVNTHHQTRPIEPSDKAEGSRPTFLVARSTLLQFYAVTSPSLCNNSVRCKSCVECPVFACTRGRHGLRHGFIADTDQTSTWHSRMATPLYNTSTPMDQLYAFAPFHTQRPDSDTCSTSILSTNRPTTTFPSNGRIQDQPL